MLRAAALLKAVFDAIWGRRIFPRIGWALGYFRSNRQTESVWPAPSAPLGPDVALFVHFDRQGAVRPHVLGYLRALRAAGLDVVLVSNSGRLRPEALEAVKQVCAAVLERRNVGYDFGAWQDALATLALPRPETRRLYFVNDSVYGPLGALDGVLARMDFAAADMWGLTDSWQGRFHLQSYFLGAGPAAFGHPAWAAFWASVRPAPSKHWIIHRYEIGLSQAMLKAGLRLRAVWPYAGLTRDWDPALLADASDDEGASLDPALKARRSHALRIRKQVVQRVPLNPTSDLWRQLLDGGYPFIKRELLRLNPTDVQDIAEWRSKLEARGADPDDIDQDLQRALRHRSP